MKIDSTSQPLKQGWMMWNLAEWGDLGGDLVPLTMEMDVPTINQVSRGPKGDLGKQHNTVTDKVKGWHHYRCEIAKILKWSLKLAA